MKKISKLLVLALCLILSTCSNMYAKKNLHTNLNFNNSMDNLKISIIFLILFILIPIIYNNTKPENEIFSKVKNLLEDEENYRFVTSESEDQNLFSVFKPGFPYNIAHKWPGKRFYNEESVQLYKGWWYMGGQRDNFNYDYFKCSGRITINSPFCFSALKETKSINGSLLAVKSVDGKILELELSYVPLNEYGDEYGQYNVMSNSRCLCTIVPIKS